MLWWCDTMSIGAQFVHKSSVMLEQVWGPLVTEIYIYIWDIWHIWHIWHTPFSRNLKWHSIQLYASLFVATVCEKPTYFLPLCAQRRQIIRSFVHGSQKSRSKRIDSCASHSRRFQQWWYEVGVRERVRHKFTGFFSKERICFIIIGDGITQRIWTNICWKTAFSCCANRIPLTQADAHNHTTNTYCK